MSIGSGRVQGGHSRVYSIFDNEKNMGAAGQEDTLMCLTRAFHMLVVDGHDLFDAKDAADLAVLVAMYMADVHTELSGYHCWHRSTVGLQGYWLHCRPSVIGNRSK